MRANRRTDTKPEVRLRSALHRLGFRFRKDYPIIVGGRRIRVDLAFPRKRVVIFVDGCFWHGCPSHCRVPKANADYWAPKIKGNAERDRQTDLKLQQLGWKVVRIWEHDSIDLAVAQVLDNLPSQTAIDNDHHPEVARRGPHS
jgi:DNA mismatch endonuclease, patch repair protein